MYRRHIERASWLEERLKPQTSHVAREIINLRVAETHTGGDKAGHCFVKVVEEMNVTCLKYFFSSNVREGHQTSGTFQESSTSKPDLKLSSYLSSEMKQSLQTAATQHISSSPTLTIEQRSPQGWQTLTKNFLFPSCSIWNVL